MDGLIYFNKARLGPLQEKVSEAMEEHGMLLSEVFATSAITWTINAPITIKEDSKPLVDMLEELFSLNDDIDVANAAQIREYQVCMNALAQVSAKILDVLNLRLESINDQKRNTKAQIKRIK